MGVIWHRWTSRDLDHRSTVLRVGALALGAVYTALAVLVDPRGLGLYIWFRPRSG